MERIKLSTSKIELKVNIELSEIEVRALMKMCQYGHKPYIEWFRNNLSKYELEGLESGIVSLFNTIRGELPKHINRVDEARKHLTSKK